MKILFADDDLKYSMLLKRFLEKEGYEVVYAGNGTIALEQFPLIKPDLVLLDINMPGLNGFEVAERIREADRHVLIFFLSDRSDKADRLQGFQLRANDYLAKPFYPEELIARIRERFASQLSEVVEEETYSFGNSVFNYSTNEIRTGNSKVLITSRQADILRLLALNKNVSVARDRLLETVWGSSSYSNSLALNVQITYLRKALKNDPTVVVDEKRICAYGRCRLSYGYFLIFSKILLSIRLPNSGLVGINFVSYLRPLILRVVGGMSVFPALRRASLSIVSCSSPN